MLSSRGTKQYGKTTDDQLKEILETTTAGLNTVKPEATFSRTPGEEIVEKFIDESTVMGIIL